MKRRIIMFCKSCGKQIGDNERFCPHCGAAVGAPQQAAPGGYQQAPGQPYQYRAPAAPKNNANVFALVLSIVFGAAALFALLAFIGFCTSGNAAFNGAGSIISFIFVILSCIGIAIAPLLKQYAKLCITICAATLFLGIYGLSVIMIRGSVGYLFLLLGFAALAFLCWLHYTKNNIASQFWTIFVPAGVMFLGFLLNWIIMKYFSNMRGSLVLFLLFDFLFGITIVGGAVILGLYLLKIKDDKFAKISMPNPGAKAPQPPYQGR